MFRLLKRKINLSKKVAEVKKILLPQFSSKSEILYFEMFLSARYTNLFDKFFFILSLLTWKFLQLTDAYFVIFSAFFGQISFKSLKKIVYLRECTFFYRNIYFFICWNLWILILKFSILLMNETERNYEFKLKYPKNYIRSKIKNDIF